MTEAGIKKPGVGGRGVMGSHFDAFVDEQRPYWDGMLMWEEAEAVYAATYLGRLAMLRDALAELRASIWASLKRRRPR
jgi:hypothetical protein